MRDWLHEEVVAWLIAVLRPWVRERGGRIGGSGARIAVADDRGRRPDIVVFLRSMPQARGLIIAVPDVVVEVVSATPDDQRRDRVEKLAEYARRGIACYWLVDPALRSFEVLEEAALAHADVQRGGSCANGSTTRSPSKSMPSCRSSVRRLEQSSV